MRELTLADVSRVAAILKQCVPDLGEVYVFGSAAVAALHPELDGVLRRSVDIDVAPKDKPAFVMDSRFVEERAGQDSAFYDREGYYLDYVPVEVLKLTPPGWQSRAIPHEIAPGLLGYFLAPLDVAYNKLWVGRPKDLAYVRDILAVGLVALADLRNLHDSNIAMTTTDREKVEKSLRLLAPLQDSE